MPPCEQFFLWVSLLLLLCHKCLGNVTIVTPQEWAAEPAISSTPLSHPIANVLITETETESCNVTAVCRFLVRHLQKTHKERYSLWDIKFNFLIGGDGKVYEGRGWNFLSTSVSDLNKGNLVVAFIGSFSHESPTEKQINVARHLIRLGVKLGYVKENHRVTTASQIPREGISSGQKLDEVVKTWPRWTDNYSQHNSASANVTILSRREWVAEPPTNTTALTLPVSNVLITETETANCDSTSDCVFVVRHLQTSDKEGHSLWDIKSNFLVGADGMIYEGRGWNVRGDSVADCNKNSIGIAFIGSFSSDAPQKKQIQAARSLIRMGVKSGYIKREYKAVTSSQIRGDGMGSGEELDKAVKTWSHWSNVDYFNNSVLREEFCNS